MTAILSPHAKTQAQAPTVVLAIKDTLVMERRAQVLIKFPNFNVYTVVLVYVLYDVKSLHLRNDIEDLGTMYSGLAEVEEN